MTTIQPKDKYYMSLAINEAKKGLYTTRPNPAVGCIIIKDQQIIGTGYHPKAGEPHAEVFALVQAATYPTGTQSATAYVTLEPCSHTGKTPPCAKALVKAGISRVVIGGLDPNPKVAGRGVKILEDAGVEVVVGVLTEQAEQLNKGFLKAMRTGKPFVRVKIAASLDGRTAMASGESKWITGDAARQDVQKIRALSGAIVTGSQTIIDDNPQLNVRSQQLGVPSEQVPSPKVVVLDRRQRLSANSNYHVCQRAEPEATLFWRTDDLEQMLLEMVEQHQCYDILVEAGATVAGKFIELGLVDELIIYQAPCILGSDAKPMVETSIAQLSNQHRYQLSSVQTIGDDIKMVLLP